MTTASKPEPTGTAVATTQKSETSARIDRVRDENRERNALVAAIRGTAWGRDCSVEMARYVAQYARENGLDAVRHVELLGGRIYLTAELYDEKGAPLIRDGVIIPAEPDYVNADERLEKLAAAGDAWAKEENTRRQRLRITYNVPEKAAAAVVQRFTIGQSGATIIGVNWCGGPEGRKNDPVGNAEPAKTAQTRARRRAWKQIADIIPGYAQIIRPIEASARIASQGLPVAVVDAPRLPRPLATEGIDGYGDAGAAVNNAPIPPAQHSDDAARVAEDGELPLGDSRPAPARGGNAQFD